MKLKEIDKKINKLNTELAELNSLRDQSLSHKTLTCETSVLGEGCDKKTQVRNLVWIRTYHYVEPFSCTGGDYYVEAEGFFICPKCGNINRTYNRNQEASSLRKYFMAEVDLRTDWYGREDWDGVRAQVTEIMENK